MNLFGTIQQIEQQADDLAKRVGDVAQQVQDGTAAVRAAIATPVVITTPTPTTAGSVRPALLPGTVKALLFAAGALILFRMLK